MANVKINRGAEMGAAAETPSQQLVRQGNDPHEVTDARGRVIVLKRPSTLSRLRFIEALGESSTNRLWVGTVSPLMYVSSIDGTPVSPPISKREIEALYTRLDEDGLEAVSAGLAEHFQSANEVDVDAAKK